MSFSLTLTYLLFKHNILEEVFDIHKGKKKKQNLMNVFNIFLYIFACMKKKC